MADTAGVTSNDDNAAQPATTPADSAPGRAPRKAFINSWLFPVAGGLCGAYFLISGALMVREKHGNGTFVLLVTGIVALVAVIGVLIHRSTRTKRPAGE